MAVPVLNGPELYSKYGPVVSTPTGPTEATLLVRVICIHREPLAPSGFPMTWASDASILVTVTGGLPVGM